MPGVVRVYVYRLKPPKDALTLATGIHAAGQLITKHNKNVLKVDTIPDTDGVHMLMRLTVQGHDQWWIKKNIIYPVVGILTKVGIKVKDVNLHAVEKPPDTRSTRPRASDGRSTPVDADFMINHEDVLGQPLA